MPVAVATTHLWSTQQLFPPTGGDLHAPRLLAATCPTRGLCQCLYSADAKSPHRDERAVGQRDHRYQRGDRHGYPAGHFEGMGGGAGRPAGVSILRRLPVQKEMDRLRGGFLQFGDDQKRPSRGTSYCWVGGKKMVWVRGSACGVPVANAEPRTVTGAAIKLESGARK